MTTHDPLLPAVVLQRKAVVYVRQSTPQQVQLNLESRRRQYELVEVARRRGFTNIEVIDDDLGRTASGAVERPGFDRLVAALCAGQVGAVLCLEASQLARNGRDWHHLLELCGLVEARVIDLDGVYDPCRPNDRLLLGMKGSISEFELGIIRSRMYEAARSKAKRGELKISSPIGYAWDRYVGLGLDPDRRLQEVIRLVFQKFRELGSARQVLLWMASQNVHFPYPSNGRTLTSFEWRPIRYRNVISILKIPSMPASTLTARARSAPRSSMVVRARAMATASRWVRGRYSSRIITRATSVGRSTNAIRRCSRATPTAGLVTRSLDEAGAPCWPVSSAVRAAVVGSAFSTPVAIRGRSTGANSRTCSWASGVA